MSERAAGFYWVKTREDGEWTIAEWTGGDYSDTWNLMGTEVLVRDDGLAEIGPKIEPHA